MWFFTLIMWCLIFGIMALLLGHVAMDIALEDKESE